MIVKNLGHTDFDELIECFLIAFENYFVKMPTDKAYYKKRWEVANVDFNLSYGMFENERLVGFIINAIDKRNGKLTAYNTGTGVIPEYRGKKIVKSIYDYALSDLKEHGVVNCSLEVITENNRAIQSYQSIGFKICKTYKCFKGEISAEENNHVDLEEIEFNNMEWENLPNQEFYSWDFQKEPIEKGNYKCYKILNNRIPESYFIINPDNGTLAQFNVLNFTDNGWNRLFLGIKQISETIKINNVDERLTHKIDYLNKIGLTNTVDQYEMELKIRS